jgi:hypothetical protein
LTWIVLEHHAEDDTSDFEPANPLDMNRRTSILPVVVLVSFSLRFTVFVVDFVEEEVPKVFVE